MTENGLEVARRDRSASALGLPYGLTGLLALLPEPPMPGRRDWRTFGAPARRDEEMGCAMAPGNAQSR